MSPYLVSTHLFSLNDMEQRSMIKSITYILTHAPAKIFSAAVELTHIKHQFCSDFDEHPIRLLHLNVWGDQFLHACSVCN